MKCGEHVPSHPLARGFEDKYKAMATWNRHVRDHEKGDLK